MAKLKAVAKGRKPGARKGGTPPKEHQFKPGQSGNSKGRPRKDETLKSLMRKELGEELEVLEGGRPSILTYREALAKQVARKALQGDYKMLRMLLEVDQPEPEAAPHSQDRAEQDAKAYDAVLTVLTPEVAPATAPDTPKAESPSTSGDDEQLWLPFSEAS